MPTPSGLPKPGDQLYNNYFKQRFVVAGRSSNSFPMSVDIQPYGGRDLPPEMQRSGKINPNGTYRLFLEAPPDDLFRMGLSQWTNLPDQGSIEPGRRKHCKRGDAHSAHLYLRHYVWHYCPGIKSPEKPAPAETLIPAGAITVRVRDGVPEITGFSEGLPNGTGQLAFSTFTAAPRKETK